MTGLPRTLAPTLLLLSLLCSQAAAQEKPKLAGEESLAFQILLQTPDFGGAATGEGGDASSSVIALRLLLARPRSESEPLLRELVERAEPGGQLYALCGLYSLDRDLCRKLAKPFYDDERLIAFCAVGCSVDYALVKDVVRSRSRWAVRLPKGYPSSNWRTWVKAQGWPKRAWARPDIVGGAFPVELTLDADFLQPRAPQGKLQNWIQALSKEDADAEDIGSALARFGKPGFMAVQELAKRPDSPAKIAAASAVFNLGAEELGDASPQAARALGALLLDPDPRVAYEAALALYTLRPWHRAAEEFVLRALEELPQRLAKDPSGETLEFADYLLSALGTLPGKRAIPALTALLQTSQEDVRCTASCRLGRLGSEAKGARSALLAGYQDGSVPCGLESLERIGLGDRAQAIEVVKLLEDEDERETAAKLLGGLGPQAGPEAARALEALVLRPDCDSASLRLALFRITGAREGLVDRVVAAFGAPKAARVCDSPELLRDLGSILGRKGKLRLKALSVLEELGPKAKTLEAPLRAALAEIDLEGPEGAAAGAALEEVSGDVTFTLRVTARALERDGSAGLAGVRRLGPAALPLLPELQAAIKRADQDLRPKLIGVLPRLGRGAEAQLVPYLEARLSDSALAPTVISALGELALSGSGLAKGALERLLARTKDPKLQALIYEELDQVSGSDLVE